MTDTHIHTPMPSLDLACVRTHTHLGRFFYSTSRSASITPTQTRTSSCVLEICLTMTHTYTHAYPAFFVVVLLCVGSLAQAGAYGCACLPSVLVPPTELWELENGRSTPGCLTVQSAIQLSLLRRLVAH